MCVFFRPRKRGEKRSFGGRLDFFRPLAHAGGCTQKKKKRRSTQKMTKVSKIPSLWASDTAKGPCKHNRLYLCVEGSIYIYMLLSPDAERPPSRPLAHTGARYEISDLREIYGAGTRTSACSSGGCFSGEGPQSMPFWRRVRRALAPRRFAGNPRRSLFGGWALPKRNVFGVWHR